MMVMSSNWENPSWDSQVGKCKAVRTYMQENQTPERTE